MTPKQIYILYNFDITTSSLTVELTINAKSTLDFITKIRTSAKLQILHELMIASDYEVELEELEKSNDLIIEWLENNMQFGISSFTYKNE